MTSPIDRNLLLPQVRAMQAIVAALTIGIVMFALMASVLEVRDPNGGTSLSLIALAFGSVCLVLAIVIPQTISATETLSGVGAYQTRLIVSCGLLEGGAFLNLIAFWLEQHSFSLALALLFLCAILLQFPTVERLANWLARHDRAAQERRDFER